MFEATVAMVTTENSVVGVNNDVDEVGVVELAVYISDYSKKSTFALK